MVLLVTLTFELVIKCFYMGTIFRVYCKVKVSHPDGLLGFLIPFPGLAEMLSTMSMAMARTQAILTEVFMLPVLGTDSTAHRNAWSQS